MKSNAAMIFYILEMTITNFLHENSLDTKFMNATFKFIPLRAIVEITRTTVL
jgi:hypothetical protein